jgi:alpha-maltose-1-phosphate synthase
VIIVPSTFSKQSLAETPNLHASIQVVSYGAPPVSEFPLPKSEREKLRVLFVGALSQAKGLGYLLEAIARMNGQVELTLIGQRISAVIPASSILEKYRWLPSLPHQDLLEEMARHDVLVLPSLHEGFGLVITEAMAQGLVVMTTAHSMAPDWIENGVDGFIIPIRSADAIVDKLELLDRDREMLAAMKQAAWQKARAQTWETYRRELVRVAQDVIAFPPTS